MAGPQVHAPRPSTCYARGPGNPVSSDRPKPRKRRFVPEVVQTSAMDCGPACLKALLEGFGVPISYGRLREACQTDVDGTSIDTIEEVAQSLGLDATQVMVPVDNVLIDEAKALPCVAVVRNPDGMTHFVVLWRRHGRLVQVMDPGLGRRWISRDRLARDLYVHTMDAPLEAWRDWAGSEEFQRPLARRLRDLGVSAAAAAIERAAEDEGWRGLGTLDAATRMVDAMVRAKAVGRGRAAARMLDALIEESLATADGQPGPIAEVYWSVRAADPDQDGTAQVRVRGAVLVTAHGYTGVAAAASETPAAAGDEDQPAPAPLSPELAAALAEPPSRPGRELWRLLRAAGALTPIALVVGLCIAATGLLIEAVLLRGLLDLAGDLGVAEQRFAAMVALAAFMTALLLLEFPIAIGTQRLGRQIEISLRVAFQDKLPRLAVRYFQSRPTSDMAERSHSIYRLRQLAPLAGSVTRAIFEIGLTTAGLIWLAPDSAPIALALAATAIGVPLIMQRFLAEPNLRVRTHAGALSRFYLDALVGAIPLRTHGIERAVRREHEGLLSEWARASLAEQRASVIFESIQQVLTVGLVCWLILAYLSTSAEPAGILLLAYWALNLPALGQQIAVAARAYPMFRNLTMRLTEPLGALEATDQTSEPATEPAPAATAQPSEASPAAGVSISLDGVTVRAGGHTILSNVDLEIEPGSHVAIVGASGSGKTSLIGLLLGWHRPAAGQLRVDDRPLEGAHQNQLRQQTAWIDPSVQLWNRSLIDNLRYGDATEAPVPVAEILDAAALRSVLQRLPDGLQTQLGEGGGLVSGGEGQRVRFGRALHRHSARLVLLDEPFRGLDRNLRHELLERARAHWRDATLVCVTHDIAETKAFSRVIVIDGGRIAESGDPTELAAVTGSLYRALLDAEAQSDALWADPIWRRLTIGSDGLVSEPTPRGRQQ